MLHLVANGLFFMLDLDDGMAGLRGVEDDAGAELRVRSGLQCRDESDSER